MMPHGVKWLPSADSSVNNLSEKSPWALNKSERTITDHLSSYLLNKLKTLITKECKFDSMPLGRAVLEVGEIFFGNIVTSLDILLIFQGTWLRLNLLLQLTCKPSYTTTSCLYILMAQPSVPKYFCFHCPECALSTFGAMKAKVFGNRGLSES